MEIDKVFRGLGGKWNKHLGCHLFSRDPRPFLSNGVAETVPNLQQVQQSFYTPPAVIDLMLEHADLQPQDIVLEPSAGMGAIALAAAAIVGTANVTCIDTDPVACATLRQQHFTVYEQDFLTFTKDSPLYNAILMNPPFLKNADIHHIMHAYNLLNTREGGILVSVLSRMAGKNTRFKIQKTFQTFCQEANATRLELPDASFRTSGTLVQTDLLIIPASIL